MSKRPIGKMSNLEYRLLFGEKPGFVRLLIGTLFILLWIVAFVAVAGCGLWRLNNETSLQMSAHVQLIWMLCVAVGLVIVFAILLLDRTWKMINRMSNRKVKRTCVQTENQMLEPKAEREKIGHTPEWLVRLKGRRDDLKLLSEIGASDWHVTKEDGVYYLRSSNFSSIEDAGKVLENANGLLKSMVGAGEVYFGNFGLLEVDGIMIVEQDRPPNQYILPNGIRSSAKVGTPKVSLVGVCSDSPHQHSQFERWIALSKREDPVRKALHFFGQSVDEENAWFHLYKAYEVVKSEVGKNEIIRQGWGKEDELRLFAHTANYYHRHGAEKSEPPRVPMTLSTAKSLVRTILHGWLGLRCKLDDHK